jgi:hypothetical protein
MSVQQVAANGGSFGRSPVADGCQTLLPVLHPILEIQQAFDPVLEAPVNRGGVKILPINRVGVVVAVVLKMGASRKQVGGQQLQLPNLRTGPKGFGRIKKNHLKTRLLPQPPFQKVAV